FRWHFRCAHFSAGVYARALQRERNRRSPAAQVSRSGAEKVALRFLWPAALGPVTLQVRISFSKMKTAECSRCDRARLLRSNLHVGTHHRRDKDLSEGAWRDRNENIQPLEHFARYKRSLSGDANLRTPIHWPIDLQV